MPPTVRHVGRDLTTGGRENGKTDPGARLLRLAGGNVARLEAAIDDLTESLPELRNFIAPGGTGAAARLHLARAVCRRAERRVITLRRDEDVSQEVCVYLNRLEDLLFVLARRASHAAGTAGIIWAPRAKAPDR